MIVNMEGKVPEEASLRLSIQHIFRCVNPVFWSLSVREDWQNWPKLTLDIFHGWIQFFVAFFFLKPLESKVLLCDLRLDVRELVTTNTCEIKWKVRLKAELKASIGTTCAAVLLVAAPLLSTYLLNDWPAHVLEKHAFQWCIWRPAQLSPTFVVRTSVLSLWKDIYYISKNWKEVCSGRSSSELRQSSVCDWQTQQSFLAAEVLSVQK